MEEEKGKMLRPELINQPIKQLPVEDLLFELLDKLFSLLHLFPVVFRDLLHPMYPGLNILVLLSEEVALILPVGLRPLLKLFFV